jgi:hypothetical protein
MLHSQIEHEEIIERYARDQLAPEEREAFEQHFFACDECFAKLQDFGIFRAGIRDAASRGLLNTEPPAPAHEGRVWLSWALAVSGCAAIGFAVLAASVYFDYVPGLRRQLDQARSELGQRLPAPVEPIAPQVEQAEANIPVAMLQASRSGGSESVQLKPGDKHIVLWIELGPSRYRDFGLKVFSSGDHLITSVDHLGLSPYGALAVSLPTKQLPAGDFRITLTGQDPPPAALAGEYHVQIRRP